MVKLTPDLIYQAMQYINPVRDRELDLRGYKIPVIENMGATLDQFDCIDFSENDIRKLDGFPLLKRLKWLLLNNNRIVRISEGLEKSLPSLDTLILTGNQIQELADVDPLASIKSLRTLSLLHNPVTTRQHYRAYVIFRIPHLRVLDFRKIKMKEREDAAALFKSKKGKELQKEIAKKAKNALQNAMAAGSSEEQKPTGPTAEELWKIREAISKASSLEEVERLNRLLQAGQIPGRAHPPGVSQTDEEMEEEESSQNRSMMNGN